MIDYKSLTNHYVGPQYHMNHFYTPIRLMMVNRTTLICYYELVFNLWVSFSMKMSAACRFVVTRGKSNELVIKGLLDVVNFYMLYSLIKIKFIK